MGWGCLNPFASGREMLVSDRDGPLLERPVGELTWRGDILQGEAPGRAKPPLKT